MGDTILFNVNEGLARLTLNRPDRLNAFNVRMHEEISEAMTVVETDPAVRAVLISAAGRGFCAGQDLSDRKPSSDGAPADLGASLDERYNPLVRRMRALEKPIVCAVNGVAAGAGANFALSCDIVIAACSASFLQAFCKIGLVPDSGGTWTLPRLVGNARAMGMALLGTRIEATQAAEWGLIWRVVEDATLIDVAEAIAVSLASGPTIALGFIKRALNASAANDLTTQLDLERDLQREAGQTADYREGVEAFMAKRPARFTGA
jgi:2-(1,2-epoxy-1,2-dihydrophenyl)acetyl-CoA isomerase